jgi:hypothetical protein
MDKIFYKLSEVSKIIGQSLPTLHKAKNEGKLKCFTSGAGGKTPLLVTSEELNRYKEEEFTEWTKN